MKSRTFQIGVRLSIFLAAVAYYVCVVRWTTLQMVLAYPILHDNFGERTLRGYVEVPPTLWDLHFATTGDWVYGIIVGSLLSIVLALVGVGLYYVVRLILFGRKKTFPSCDIKSCRCAYHKAADERHKRWSQYAAAAAVGAAIGAIASK